MSVITISRGTFSGGKMLAECLAARLQYRCIDRDAIVERAAVPGVSQEVLRDALQKPPSFLDRFKHKKYMYLTLLQAALAEEVRTGRAVYHGNAGHLLLKGGTPVLRTRIIAPVEFRVKMAMQQLKVGRNEAINYIQKVDQDRQKWTHYLYGVDWGDPVLYDIVLNLEYLSIDEACDTLVHMVKKRCFEFNEECQAAMNDLALASRVKADLVLNRETEALELEVTAHNGLVTIKGKLASLDQFREIERTAKAVQGVTALNMDAVAPPGPD